MECPCGSGALYSACCGLLHEGMAALRPSTLMRARYSAYAVGNVDFIMHTTHPMNAHFRRKKEPWRSSLALWCKQTEFKKLEIVDIQENADSKEGYVTFRAFLQTGDESYVLHEKSYFIKTAAGWLYRDGIHLP